MRCGVGGWDGADAVHVLEQTAQVDIEHLIEIDFTWLRTHSIYIQRRSAAHLSQEMSWVWAFEATVR